MSDLPNPTSTGNTNDQNPITNPLTSGLIYNNSDDPGDGQNQTPTLDTIVQPQPSIQPPTQPISGGMQKEIEPPIQTESSASSEPVSLEETMGEMEIEPDLEDVGVEKISGTVDLPPDMKKMGVQSISPTQPVAQIPVVNLPIPDDLIEKGLHAQIISSLRWLAEWCIRKLKKAHIHLKNLGGRIVRQQDK